jgi:hypothetical protein
MEIPRPVKGEAHSRTGARKKNEREADHSLSSSADVKKARSYIYPHSTRLQGTVFIQTHRDTFALFFSLSPRFSK